ncbi:MAG: sigma-E processing peptidase SpoIIGA, partial [Oscillospiraceae bacterium]
MVIYVDVLLLVNLYMNYFILKSASAVLHIKLGQMRAVFSSFVGSLSALSVFLEDKPIVFAAIKLAAVFLITVCAFGRERLVKNAFVTFFASTLFGGIIYGISELFSTRIKIINGNFYADISIPFLAAATI